MRLVQDMQMSGVWDGKSVPEKHPTLQSLFWTRGESSGPPPGYQFPNMWSDQQWADILDVVTQVEGDRRSHGFNKNNLPALPRYGNDQVPWLWRPDTCPEDVDKKYIFREFRARLHTMETMCNKKYETTESPATLFLEYVVQWFETGGKCHIFGFRMTPFCGHITNYSFGRGVSQKREDGSIHYIKPGAPMQTGFTMLAPTDIHKHYNIMQRTVVVESWKANSFRFDYPESKVLIGVLETAVLDLADSTKWYTAVRELDDYPSVPLPNTYKDRSAWITLIKSKRPDITSSFDDDDSDEIDDPEIDTLENVQEEIEAAQKEDETGVGEAQPLSTHEDVDMWQSQGESFLAGIDLGKQAHMRRWMDVAAATMRKDLGKGKGKGDDA
jgi:hypothetical protein